MRARARPLVLAAALAAWFVPSLGASADEGRDPFGTRSLAAPSPAQSVHPGYAAPSCAARVDASMELSLADVVSRALCNNPQTRVAWASALAQAAQVGVAKSAFLPSVTASGAIDHVSAHGGGPSSLTGSYRETNGDVNVGYVLFDFGARDATLDEALQTATSAAYAQDATLQKTILSALQAYYQLFGLREAVSATQEAEKAAQESLKAATARYDAGTATPADKLLAQTAYSQAVLNRIQAQGAAKVAEGTMANVMGEDADRRFDYRAPATSAAGRGFEADLGKLIAAARERRPDLAATQAQVEAAGAAVRAARASGWPTVSVVANAGSTDTSITPSLGTGTIGLQLTVPLFSGFETTYRVRSAQAQLESQKAQRDNASSQVALDVWQAYYNLDTGTQAVRSSADLVASAQAAAQVALGRYKAGAGTLLDALTAQASLANARLQEIQARYNWFVLRADLAQALGQLDFARATSLEARPGTTP